MCAETGNTALHELPMGFTQLYPALLDAGADIGARNFAGRTPLHCAAAAGNFQLARLLLRDGASATAAAHGGETPMHAAAAADARAAPQLIQCIAQHGGDPDVVNDAGVTPMEIACGVPHGQAAAVCSCPCTTPKAANMCELAVNNPK
jgi:ankyrin repeat protein